MPEQPSQSPASPPRPPLAPGASSASSPAAASAPGEVAAGTKPAEQPLLLPKAKKPHEPKDNLRDIIETVVFVIVLVLLLKTFIAEAFVIPTGSMATTLLGYHKDVTCPKCGYNFVVNASKEADAQERWPQLVTGCTCPNCRYRVKIQPRRAGVEGELP